MNEFLSRYTQQFGSPPAGDAVLSEEFKDDKLAGRLFGRLMGGLQNLERHIPSLANYYR